MSTRRELLRRTLLLGGGAALVDAIGPAQFLSAASAQDGSGAYVPGNPLTQMPPRDWEQIYRNQYADDSSFVFTCAPNDTHNCLLRAHVKNGVVVRISPTYGYGKATDLYGNQASHRWDPRICQKGLILSRRFYGDRRVKAPMIRKGFKKWVEAGFPREADGTPQSSLELRGSDDWIKISWDEATSIAARTLENVARTWGGEDGAAKLRQQGYDEEMVEAMHGAGVQAIKMRGGMPLLGIGRIFGFYRFANMLA
ncbi:MAG: molybdopterin oxidoreductase, partial [Gaiella sp.]